VLILDRVVGKLRIIKAALFDGDIGVFISQWVLFTGNWLSTVISGG
jgi:hypothetical protein